MSFSLRGSPSDEVGDVLATGDSDIRVIFVSMSAGDPARRDHDYLEWHTYDHRPEQHRVASIRASIRLMSTMACRELRIVAESPYDEVNHLMTYFFDDVAGLATFTQLAHALNNAGRMPVSLPPIERGVYRVGARGAARRLKIGADVLPWWPAQNVIVLIERGAAPIEPLLEAKGVAGVWSATSANELLPSSLSIASVTTEGETVLSYLFLDGDPLRTCELLRPILVDRWETTNVVPLLAQPFKAINSRRDWEGLAT